MTLIKSAKIRTDGGTQARAGLNKETVHQYRELLTGSGGQWPFKDPIVVFYDGEHYWLADGFHRVHACRVSGHFELDADVRQGTRREAQLYAAGANADHGLQRTDEDKLRAVTLLLEDEQWSRWSDRKIARCCKVSPTFVGTIRKELTVHVDSDERTYIDKHGNETTMNTGNIGSQYEPVWKLERLVRAWLDDQPDAFAAISAIKLGRNDNRLHEMSDYLKQEQVKFRQGDLWQSCNNVFDQMRQERRVSAPVGTAVSAPPEIFTVNGIEAVKNTQVFAAVKQLRDAGFAVEHLGNPANPDAPHDDLRVWSVNSGEPVSKNRLWQMIGELDTVVPGPPEENSLETTLKTAIQLIEGLAADKSLGIEVVGPLARALGPLYDAEKALKATTVSTNDDNPAVAWLRSYEDTHGRSWHDLTPNQTHHVNSPCYQAFVAAFPDEKEPKLLLKQARAQLERETAVLEEARS